MGTSEWRIGKWQLSMNFVRCLVWHHGDRRHINVNFCRIILVSSVSYCSLQTKFSTVSVNFSYHKRKNGRWKAAIPKIIAEEKSDRLCYIKPLKKLWKYKLCFMSASTRTTTCSAKKSKFCANPHLAAKTFKKIRHIPAQAYRPKFQNAQLEMARTTA